MYVRPIFDSFLNFTRQPCSPAIGQAVEALTRSSSDAHCEFGWWLATVRHHRQGYFVINYTGHPESFNEIVEAETLRPCNPASSLRADALHAALVPVPADLKDWARSLADRAFASVQNASDVHAIAYDEARGALSIVGATADKVKRAKILTELQLRHEGDIARLHARKAQTAAALEAARQKIDTQVCFGQ